MGGVRAPEAAHVHSSGGGKRTGGDGVAWIEANGTDHAYGGQPRVDAGQRRGRATSDREERDAFARTTVEFYERMEALDANEVELHGASVQYKRLVGVDSERGVGRPGGRRLQEQMVGPEQQIAPREIVGSDTTAVTA